MVKIKKMNVIKSYPSSSSILHIIAYTSKLLFPKYPCHYFPIFSFMELVKKFKCNVKPADMKLKLKPIPNKLYDIMIKNEIIKSELIMFVTQYTFDIFVRNKEINWVNLLPKSQQNGLISSYFGKQSQSQLVQIRSWKNSQINCVFVKENFFQNFKDKHKIDDTDIYVSLQEIQDNQNLPMISTKASISITNSPYEIHAELSETILTKYFENARLLHRNHIYEIILDESLLGSFYYSRYFHIFSHLKKIYFKCTNLETKESDFEFSAIVVKNFTELIQVNGTHAFLPKQILHDLCFIKQFPAGLQKYYNELKSCFLPFINQSTQQQTSNNFNDFTSRQIFPIFLLQGDRGAGKFTILNAIGQSLGMYIYHADCTDIISPISSQTEAKLNIVLNRPNLCVPLIICLQNFEVFGIESNGHEDLRIISSFQSEIIELFTKVYPYPVILVALSNTKIQQPIIQRLFLETINILPPNKEERYDILKWLEIKENLNEKIFNDNYEKISLIDSKLSNRIKSVNDEKLLEIVAGKTQGFLYGDLKLLFDNSIKEMKFNEMNILKMEHLETNLVTMQSAFADSLGAPKVPKVLWSDIGGLAKLKDEIQSSIGLPLKHIHLMGKNMRRSGILLYGPPGTGKTLVAKAVATECNLSFLSVQGPELLNMYVGQSEQNVREVFSRARSAAPCVIFLDELDSLAPNRGVAGDSGGVMDRVVSQLLAEMDGMTSNSDPQKQIFILAATNRPDLIDNALLRPGRFDKLLFVGPCTTVEDKIAVLNAITQKFILDDNLILTEVAEMLTEDMTGADLYSICSNAWLSAVRRTVLEQKKDFIKISNQHNVHDSVTVKLEDFQSATMKFIPSVSQKDLEYFRKLRNNFSP